MFSIPVAMFSSVAAALLSRFIRKMWLRAILVVVVAYGSAFFSLTIVSLVTQTDDQFASWFPLMLNASFGAGLVAGIGALLISNWLLKPRGPHAR
jgi:peptidoglycan/LPS O-acetylase OafA/YrhL